MALFRTYVVDSLHFMLKHSQCNLNERDISDKDPLNAFENAWSTHEWDKVGCFFVCLFFSKLFSLFFLAQNHT